MMGKIKLNLVSGAIVEKPLINAFKANNNSYVVLDNEVNGSMGLPIILVCKLENNRLIKIGDQGEWQIVKEYLKNIIAGNQIEFISIDSEMAADDIYYTQLTLPVPSFDALKNAYKVEEMSVASNSIEINSEPVVEIAEPTAPVDVVSNQFNIPVGDIQPNTQNIETEVAPVVNPEIPVVDEPIVNMEAPAIDLSTPMPTFSMADNFPSAVDPVIPEPVVEESPVIENSTAIVSNEIDMFKEQKEAFMLACENMFDALVQKFQKELENRK